MMKNKILAVMLGHAVGDALGVPVEFSWRDELDINPVRDMMGYGSYNLPKGCWSDDTSLSLATLDSLKSGRVDYLEIMDNFLAFYERDEYTPMGVMFDIGRTCLASIRRYAKGTHPLECGQRDELSNGNGSLMRIHPAALYLYFTGYETEEALREIGDLSSLTHAHERSRVGCGIYSLVLWELLRSPEKEAVYRGLCRAEKIYAESPEFSHYKKKLIDRIGKRDNLGGKCKIFRDEIESSGYIVDTLEAAVWCVLTTNDYKSCVLKAVNLGRDTDTVAAVAGGLAGALYGLSAIPTGWLRALRRRKYIEKLCNEAARAWSALADEGSAQGADRRKEGD
jgi:ADP-ribosylglycohydrolase